MAYKDLRITVMCGLFRDFDKGEEVEQAESGLNLSPDDYIFWECGQFEGMAQIVSYDGKNLRFKKIS